MRLAPILCLIAGAVAGCRSAPTAARRVQPFEGIVVYPDRRTVEIDAWSCLDAGWLEQIACSPDTREHEALVVIEARPSEIHAALQLAGYRSGSPGAWSYEGGTVALTPPTGDAIDIDVRYEHEGETVIEPIGAWIEDGRGRATFPGGPWIFGGSILAPNPEWMGPGEHYVADLSGSIIGLVTFGDEVVGYREVIADQEAVQAPEWRVRADHVPPVGTPVTLILRPAG